MLALIVTVALGADLTVDLDTESSSGTVWVRLYDGREAYPGGIAPSTRAQSVDLESERSTLFEDLHPGTYAVVVFHDVDNDGKIASNWIGIPTEPVGVYLPPGVRLWGPPSFRRTSFDLQDDARFTVSLVTP